MARLVIARLHAGPIAPEWLTGWDELRKPVTPDGSPDWATYSAVRRVVHCARNEAVAFTLNEHSEATHLFFLDDDVIPPPDGLLRLLADSEAYDLPIVTGLYLQRSAPHLPVVYRYDPDASRHVQITRFCPGLQEVDACGGGCLVVRTDVLRAIAATGEQPFDYLPGMDASEDVAFCLRARRLGYRLALDFYVACQHLTTVAIAYETHSAAWRHGAIHFTSERIARLSQEIRPLAQRVG